MRVKKILKKVLLLVSLSLIILISIFLFKNKNNLPKSFDITIADTGIDVSIENFHLIEEKKGIKQWELNADRAEVINSERITRLRSISMDFFRKSGNNILVTADSGIIKNDNNDIDLKGNVKVSSNDGYVLETENLKWMSEEKMVQTDDEVDINGTDVRITGKSLTVDVENETLEIFSNVKVLFYGVKKEI